MSLLSRLMALASIKSVSRPPIVSVERDSLSDDPLTVTIPRGGTDKEGAVEATCDIGGDAIAFGFSLVVLVTFTAVHI